VLGVRPHHEPRDVLDEEQRNALSIAPVDVKGDLLRALGIDDPPEARALTGAAFHEPSLVGDDANGLLLDARVGADHLASQRFLEFVERTVIDDGAQHGVHVVGHAVVAGEKVIKGGRL
jgi:hypothetical protein